MLDVHAPEHRISGVRDFFIHLFTITVGLLIALALENAAEAWHHRQERKEAETLIREELAENRKTVLEAKPKVEEEIRLMRAVLGYVIARSNNESGEFPETQISFGTSPLADSAWSTARSTGVLQWLPYPEVQKFADVYKEQALFDKTAQEALSDYAQISSFAPQKRSEKFELSPATAQQALPLVRQTLGHLQGVHASALGALGAYDEALK